MVRGELHSGQILFTGYGIDTATANAKTALLNNVQFDGYSFGQATLIVNGSNIEIVPVHEPGTILSVATAGTGVAGWVRRRRA